MAEEITGGPDLMLMGDWLVVPVEGCNCAGGTAESSYAHESSCGYEPVGDVNTLLRDGTRSAVLDEMMRDPAIAGPLLGLIEARRAFGGLSAENAERYAAMLNSAEAIDGIERRRHERDQQRRAEEAAAAAAARLRRIDERRDAARAALR